MVRYYCNSPVPGGAGIDWMSGFHRLRVDVPDSSGVWPNGRIEVVNGGGGNGGMYLRILPTGGRELAVVVALQGEAHRIIGEIGNMRLPVATIIAIGRSEVDRREAPHENLVVAAWVRDGQILIIDQIAGRELFWWVFSANGAERLTQREIVPGIKTILGR